MDTAGRAAALSPSEQLLESFNAKSGVGDDAAQCAGADLLVVGNNDPGIRLIAAQNHVAAGLTAEHEPGALKGGADFAAG
jgi:hypothetical protein